MSAPNPSDRVGDGGSPEQLDLLPTERSISEEAGVSQAHVRSPMRMPAALPPDELRKLIAEIRDAMRAEVVGSDDIVVRLSLIAALHVGGGLERGQRVLIIGPSGSGKSTLMRALRSAFECTGWRLPFAVTDALDLTSPGWQGMSIGDLIEAALGNEPADSVLARHAVVVLDELHHAGLVVDESHRVKRQEVLGSLLGVVGDGGVVHLGDSAREWSSRHALVIGLGAFTGSLHEGKPPSPRDLATAGIPIELATRFEEVMMLRRLPEDQLRDLLRQWPALLSLTAVCERLGFAVRIHDQTIRRAARAVILNDDDATPRTAGGWLVSALRSALIAALEDSGSRELEITPDSLSIARTSSQNRRGDDPPGDADGWDATTILTRR